ncbi:MULTISPECIES: DUF2785 domain-containing protein [unclassified Colwellia]|uniref:DUF2785 domain-containing protein n=1 Tax=unclassified Colwellia TaxID=196834 RepID=UPI0015F4BCC2|nr:MULTISPECIES: DUF2785 domain-containing protein [unclassified Colwellia]MBA6380169.1 DUF2785 domain-containing protein [Colwellia sp. BRX10-7]MBA6387381.1 DUF2785 domain-containing protein [Colwellia sp. BRX10-2]MBA6402468.1 DUF2785 domain-containing protein [Colwellia sp. BRX10-5]MBA6406600.1 DUF2785 domain-containing protein [Colwellia sp. BRX10-1]
MKFSLKIPIILMLFISSSAFSANEVLINAQQVNKQCLSKQWHKKNLLQLKEDKFTLENKADKEALALQLLACLASPDAEIRDGVAFEALSYWLRNEHLSQAIHIKMFNYLTRVLESKVTDTFGVYQSFSILVLAEVVRVDRHSPFLTADQRDYLVNVGTSFLTNVKDYRGFSTKTGWQHSIAHAADLMLQLALNPKVNKAQLDKILVALASQLTANDQHSYIQGESKRIAMAVIYVFLREQYSADDFNLWLIKVVDPAPFNQWQDVYQSEQGLIKLHNTQSFLYALYATIKPSKNKVLTEMSTYLEQVIKATK